MLLLTPCCCPIPVHLPFSFSSHLKSQPSCLASCCATTRFHTAQISWTRSKCQSTPGRAGRKFFSSGEVPGLGAAPSSGPGRTFLCFGSAREEGTTLLIHEGNVEHSAEEVLTSWRVCRTPKSCPAAGEPFLGKAAGWELAELGSAVLFPPSRWQLQRIRAVPGSGPAAFGGTRGLCHQALGTGASCPF